MTLYPLDTSYTRIEYPSADLYNTYTIYNMADVRSDVLNNIMSSYYLHNYQILGLNGVVIGGEGLTVGFHFLFLIWNITYLNAIGHCASRSQG